MKADLHLIRKLKTYFYSIKSVTKIACPTNLKFKFHVSCPCSIADNINEKYHNISKAQCTSVKFETFKVYVQLNSLILINTELT